MTSKRYFGNATWRRYSLLLIGLAIILVSRLATCKPQAAQQPPQTGESPPFEATPDSLLPKLITTDSGKAYPHVFEAAFVPGTQLDDFGYLRSFTAMDVGNIQVTSGKLVACDPINIEYNPAFVDDFPIGTFPVQMARLESDNVFCRIHFRNAEVAQWEVALQPWEKPVVIGKQEPYCFGVDTGVGVLIDKDAKKAFVALGEDKVEQMFNWSESKPYPTAEIYPFGDHSLVTYTTGAGDGCYAVYVGKDSSSQICRLLVDFSLVDWY